MFNFQDSRITIMSMMQSPFLGDMTTEVESWCSALQQVEEITDLWFTCQKKVGVFIPLLQESKRVAFVNGANERNEFFEKK